MDVEHVDRKLGCHSEVVFVKTPPDARGKKQSNQVNELEIDFFFFNQCSDKQNPSLIRGE